MKKSKELDDIVKKSYQYAKERGHEYRTVEHIFLFILRSARGREILSHFHFDTNYVDRVIEQYIKKNVPVVKVVDEDFNPGTTVMLYNIMGEIVNSLFSSGREEATVGDMLAAICKFPKSYTHSILDKHGINYNKIIEVISHTTDDEYNTDYDDDIEMEQADYEERGRKGEKYLSSYTIELVSVAKEGKIDPVIGRDKEIEMVMQTLCRRKKNNPLLVGEAGVGKTAIAEGLALKIFEGDVPFILKDSRVFALDLGSMISGTKYRGDFEQRLKGVLKELEKEEKSILFIDEIHTLVGAGAAGGGSMDAANLLKPALARGELKCIGATTYSEYRTHLSKDKALSRRFSKIDVDEPSVEDAIEIIEGVKHKYEEYHGVKFSRDAIESAVNLSVKYLHDRFLPDKAMDIIDDVGANYMLKERMNKDISSIDIEESIARMLKLPSAVVSTDNTMKLRYLSDKIKESIIGQDEAIESVVKAIKRSYAGLNQDDRPIGSFLFIGPTGVGKSALSRELADSMSIHFERIDMSEYMERHSISRLIGAPPGYVGFDKGGLLTEMIKKNPHTVLLLDEIEKAHPDIMNILLQVMDGAKLTDNNGSVTDFKSVILIMTSNLGTKEGNVMGFAKSNGSQSDKALKNFFSPEFRNRLSSVVEFNQLNFEVIVDIVKTEIKKLNKQMGNRDITIILDEEAVKYLAKEGYSKVYGAREISRVIDEKIKEPLTDEILFGRLKSGGKAVVKYIEGKLSFAFSL